MVRILPCRGVRTLRKVRSKIPKEVVVGFFCSWFDSRVRSTNDNGHKEWKVSNVSEKIHVNLLWSEC
jgi:hypothetical protein